MNDISRRNFLKAMGCGALALAGSSLLPDAWAQPSLKKPNFVFILIDDMGWRDTHCYGSTFYETPNIDKLAASGVRFTNAYAACPVCSPTRASIMTGKYPGRLKITEFIGGKPQPWEKLMCPSFQQLPIEETTLAEALKPAGYECGIVGKWHLGGAPYLPENQGFDYNAGGTSAGMTASFFYPGWTKNVPVDGNDGDYLTDRLTDKALGFMGSNKDRPFMLYLSHYAVHVPLEAKQEMVEKYKAKVRPDDKQNNPYYAAMVQSVDESVGRVMEKLDNLGIADNTVVFFMSDNGGLSVFDYDPKTPSTCNAPLRAGKGYLYEGGIREPLIVRWPGVTKPGTLCSTPVTSVDFYPTMLQMAGVKPDKSDLIDGESLVPLLKRKGGLQRDAIYWHYPHYGNQGGAPGAAIREGNYKLIRFYEDNHLELYNLDLDIGERRNLASEMPEKAAIMNRKLGDWLKSVNADMPVQNSNYDPKAVSPRQQVNTP